MKMKSEKTVIPIKRTGADLSIACNAAMLSRILHTKNHNTVIDKLKKIGFLLQWDVP